MLIVVVSIRLWLAIVVSAATILEVAPVAFDTSDWRDRVPRPGFIGRIPGDVRQKLSDYTYTLCYKSSLSVPVSSKFRGCFEASVQNLMNGVFHDIGGQVGQLALGNQDIAKLLADFQHEYPTEGQSVERWRAEKAVRSKKLSICLKDPSEFINFGKACNAPMHCTLSAS